MALKITDVSDGIAQPEQRGMPDTVALLRRANTELSESVTHEQVVADSVYMRAMMERYGISLLVRLLGLSVDAIISICEHHPEPVANEVLARLEGVANALDVAHFSVEGVLDAFENSLQDTPEDEEHDCENCSHRDVCEVFNG